MRKFNGQDIELLAPAGNYEIFKSIVETKCDAVYFGGQSLNMRMIRKGFNFSDEELKSAVDLAHQHGKRAYITVNNLIDFDEIKTAEEYLLKLKEINPDALIVQDFAIIELAEKLNLSFEIHASVMMNVHNAPMVKALEKKGVKRAILSRESSLEDIRWIKSQTSMELEYFTHGDMCIAHGSQCYYSSMLFGMSSNRGKCLKPCRWWFSVSDESDEKTFPLAVKDLCMYPYIPEMISAGVTSFKIEGRMRDKDFITALINQYGDAFDRFIADPVGFDRYKDYEILYDNRKRDFSTAYAFGKPGAENINRRFEGTGKFYSTGKMFSTPTQEHHIDDETTEALRKRLETIDSVEKINKTALSVRVNTKEQAIVAIEEQVDRLYIAADVFLPYQPMSIEDIKELSKMIKDQENHPTQLYLGTPRMMKHHQFEIYKPWIKQLEPFVDGLLLGNLGAIEAFKDINLDKVGDFSLNVMNPLATKFYSEQGLTQVTASLELNADNLRDLCKGFKNIEVVVNGRLPAMYFEHDFYKVYNFSTDQTLKLHNEAGVFEIYKDQHERTHLLTTLSLNYLPLIDRIKDLDVKMVRIEGQVETLDALRNIIRRYKNVLKDDSKREEIAKAMDLSHYTYGALKF